MDMDFYTAVDELTKDDESGAGMMGVTGFNSACFYRYARIDWDLLVKNLGDDKDLARKAVEAFLRASISAVPSGKQSNFAAQNPPDFLLGVVRKDGESWSLANAFEKPVRAGREGGYLEPSIAALDAYWGRLTTVYGKDGLTPTTLCLVEGMSSENLGSTLAANREEWIGNVLSGLE
jgi:CRISPR system Cascade subunit CasC